MGFALEGLCLKLSMKIKLYHRIAVEVTTEIICHKVFEIQEKWPEETRMIKTGIKKRKFITVIKTLIKLWNRREAEFCFWLYMGWNFRLSPSQLHFHKLLVQNWDFAFNRKIGLKSIENISINSYLSIAAKVCMSYSKPNKWLKWYSNWGFISYIRKRRSCWRSENIADSYFMSDKYVERNRSSKRCVSIVRKVFGLSYDSLLMVRKILVLEMTNTGMKGDISNISYLNDESDAGP